MNPGVDDDRRPLSREEQERIFKQKILPKILTGTLPAKCRTCVVVCGEPGSGKSTAIEFSKGHFGEERTITISPDDLYLELPGLNKARMAGEFWGDERDYEKAAAQNWCEMAEQYARDNDCHIILETCSDPSPYAARMLEKGYQSAKVYFTGNDKNMTLTSVFTRAVKSFEKGVMANCAVLDIKALHDDYARVLKWAFEAEAGSTFDTVGIVTMADGVCYKNKRTRSAGRLGSWDFKPKAPERLIRLRNRPFSDQQIEELDKSWDKILGGPLAEGAEFRSYPLQQYRSRVMANVRGDAGRFDPDIVLPQDREKAQKAYARRLWKDVRLVHDHLDMNKPQDARFWKHLRRLYFDIDLKSATNVQVGKEWKDKLDEVQPRQTQQKRKRDAGMQVAAQNDVSSTNLGQSPRGVAVRRAESRPSPTIEKPPKRRRTYDARPPEASGR